MIKKLVYVVGRDTSVENVFRNRGFDVHAGYNPPEENPDLVVFTGGSDWNPKLYGEKIDGTGYINQGRDDFEVAMYDRLIDFPKAGICRGGQLFTIMNGGRLIQHVDGHTGRNHSVVEVDGTDKGTILTCHHQAMVPTKAGQIIAYDPRDKINEVVYFKDRNELAFQSHPEWDHVNTENYFFELLNRFVFKKAA